MPQNEPSDDLSDDLLVERTLAGDRSAYAILVARYQDRLYAVAYEVLHNRAEAEDVVQETFLQAYVNLGKFQRKSRFYTWLYRIAFNSAIGMARRAKRRGTVAVPNDDLQEFPSNGATPEERQQREESIQAVRAAIDTLPAEYRAVIVLREINDTSYEEIAEITGVPLGTVRSRLYRARAMLRQLILRRKDDLT